VQSKTKAQGLIMLWHWIEACQWIAFGISLNLSRLVSRKV